MSERERDEREGERDDVVRERDGLERGREERGKGLGWLTESTLSIKKKKEIEGVSANTLVDLKAGATSLSRYISLELSLQQYLSL